MGNFSYNINDDVNGRIGGDVVITSEKSKWEIIAGQYTIAVEGKEMDSNPTASGIFITSSSDYLLDVSDNLSQSTIYGILSTKSGSTLNMKSTTAMTIHSETSIAETADTTITEIAGTTIDSTAGTVYTIQSGGGSPSATNKVDINP